MIFQVMDKFKVKTIDGEQEVHPNQTIDIEQNIAKSLIEKGKIKSIDGNRLYQDMLQRIDKIYEMGDLARIEAKHKTFLQELKKKELRLLDLIYKGKDCRAIVQDIEKFIREAIGNFNLF